jgi:hypothetical protein
MVGVYWIPIVCRDSISGTRKGTLDRGPKYNVLGKQVHPMGREGGKRRDPPRDPTYALNLYYEKFKIFHVFV